MRTGFLHKMLQHGGWKRARWSTYFLWCGFTILFFYAFLTIYALYNFVETSGSLGASDLRKNVQQKWTADQTPPKIHEVEIWGKAAIGLYFWEHVMEGSLSEIDGKLVRYGIRTLGSVRLKFSTGAGVIPQTVNDKAKYVVLIINGRVKEKVDFAKRWLDALRSFTHLKKVAVILLGNEQCNNNWISPYMQENGGLVNLLYVVYDIPNRSHNIQQWPLGVATYRNFPVVNLSPAQIHSPRPYKCNFLGTLYAGSSREVLQGVFNKYNLYTACYLRIRETWRPNEDQHSAEEYYQVLLHSDLTLCPVGINVECYRIFEAMSLASVPVVEDVRTEGNCSSAPLQLLKHYNAPFIYIKSWHELPDVLRREQSLAAEQKTERRKHLLKWYTNFKKKLQNDFVLKMKHTFFD